jgi:hypothetical protein
MTHLVDALLPEAKVFREMRQLFHFFVAEHVALDGLVRKLTHGVHVQLQSGREVQKVKYDTTKKNEE